MPTDTLTATPAASSTAGTIPVTSPTTAYEVTHTTSPRGISEADHASHFNWRRSTPSARR